MEAGRGWHSRGYMRHYNPGEVPQFVTWRLDDSIPAELYLRWKAELAKEGPAGKNELYRRVEKYLDGCAGSCCLGEPTRGRIVADSINHFAGDRYELHGYVVMPNHVHLVLTPLKGYKLGSLIGGIKGFSAHEIHRIFGTNGRLWQKEYYDRMIRSIDQLKRTLAYIEWNPVKAKLCCDPKQWTYSSAFRT